MRHHVLLLPLALAVALASASTSAPASAAQASLPALALGESRPLETTLGNPALPMARDVWVEMIRSAKHTVDFEQFYLAHRPGESLQPVIDEIGRAAARGVHVRLVFDAGMSRKYPTTPDSLAKLPNIEVRLVDYKKLTGGVQHSKFLIVDGAEAWLGSQNLDWLAMTHIHELGIRMRDPQLAAAIEDVFATDWAAADTTKPFVAGAPVKLAWPLHLSQDGGRTVEATLGASPRATTPAGIPWDRDLIVQRIDGAQRTVVVQVMQYGVRSYGVADSTLHHALIAAVARGVKVRLVVADWTLGGGNEPALHDLARHGIEVRISRVPEYSGGYIAYGRVDHCKYMVVDEDWLWVGTSNWEPSYFLNTRNLGLTVHDPVLAKQAQAVFTASWNSPTAAPYGPDTQLPPRVHGEQPPAGAKVY